MIDLSKCKKGDLLYTSQGSVLEYISPTPYEGITYLDHVIKYLYDKEGKKYKGEPIGTRTNDGFVFLKNRIPETDHDVIKIVHVV